LQRLESERATLESAIGSQVMPEHLQSRSAFTPWIVT
jgi:hypothetical protein